MRFLRSFLPFFSKEVHYMELFSYLCGVKWKCPQLVESPIQQNRVSKWTWTTSHNVGCLSVFGNERLAMLTSWHGWQLTFYVKPKAMS